MTFEDFVFYFCWGCALSAINNKNLNFENHHAALKAAWFCQRNENQ